MGDRVVLHSLLEQFNDVQRKDIHDVTRGHLNENKLRHKKDDVKDSFWGSAKKEPIWMRQKVVVKNHASLKKQLPPLQRKVGAKGVVDDIKGIPAGTNSASIKHEKAKDGETSFRSNPTRRTGNEEIFYPETMVPVANQKAPFSKQFIPNHMLLPTKNEQYEQFKKTGKQLLADKNNFLNDRDKDIRQIEEKMRKELKLMECKQETSLPNYFKFKIYSDAWEELNAVLGSDGEDLKSVKKDYDSYVNALLEEQAMLDEQWSLEDYKTLLNSEEKRHTDFVKTEEEQLRILEDRLLEELKENEKLRKQVRRSSNDETKVIPQVEESGGEQVDDKGSHGDLNVKDSTVEDLESHVIRLHAQIEEQYHEIEMIKKTQREEYVPRAVCQRLEQCIKEIEVDTQKLAKQNDFLEQDIQELEEELEKVLVKTGCKDIDAELLWHRVSLSRVLNW